MVYSVHYDPITKSPFQLDGFIVHKQFRYKDDKDSPLDSEVYQYVMNLTSTTTIDTNQFVIHSQDDSDQLKRKALPISKTRPYHWLLYESKVLLLKNGTVITEGVGKIGYEQAEVSDIFGYPTRSYNLDETGVEAIPFFASTWELLFPIATKRGYTTKDIFEVMRAQLAADIGGEKTDELFFTYDTVLRNTKNFVVKYVPDNGTRYTHPFECQTEKQRIVRSILHKFKRRTPSMDHVSTGNTVCLQKSPTTGKYWSIIRPTYCYSRVGMNPNQHVKDTIPLSYVASIEIGRMQNNIPIVHKQFTKVITHRDVTSLIQNYITKQYTIVTTPQYNVVTKEHQSKPHSSHTRKHTRVSFYQKTKKDIVHFVIRTLFT